MKKLNFAVLLWGILLLLPLMVSGQRYISGRVTDGADGGPVPGASVFIAETTVGMATDTAGNFRFALPGAGSYRLVVSHAGYQTFFFDIEPELASREINIALQIRELDEVTVSKRINVRKTDIDLFWKTVLGMKPAKNRIFATNPEAVFSTVPLRIISIVGGLVSFFAFIYLIITVVKALIWGNPVSGYPSLMSVILFLGGFILLALGIIGEYLGIIYKETKQRPTYFVNEYKNSN